jgi:hypothetical protein
LVNQFTRFGITHIGNNQRFTVECSIAIGSMQMAIDLFRLKWRGTKEEPQNDMGYRLVWKQIIQLVQAPLPDTD